MSKNLNDHSLIKEEEKKDHNNQAFIENMLSENSFLLKQSQSNCCKCNCCTKIPLFLCFFLIASIFLIILLGAFLVTGIVLMKSLYKEINDLYFTNFVIDPIINKKTNSTQSFNIKNEVLDSIYLESKLTNMQIASEFILENLDKYKDDTNIINKMTSNNNFKCIRIDGEENTENNDCTNNYEDNYYVYKNEENNIDEDFKKFFFGMTPYLRFFENNLEFKDIFENKFLNMKEFFFYLKKNNDDSDNNENNNQNNEDKFKVLLTYCNNWNTENGLIEYVFNSSNFNDIINEINTNNINSEEDDSNTFVEYIVNNDFNDEKINQLNYLKMKTFNISYKNNKYNILVGIRLDGDSINNLFNKQNSNMTTIAPITKTNQFNESELHLLYNSKYFDDFFEYGIKNVISEGSYIIPNEEYSETLDYASTNIITFFDLLNYVTKNDEDENNYLYNTIWKEDFTTIIKLILDIVGNATLPQLNCKEDDDNYNILCEANKEFNKEESEIIFSDIKLKENDNVIEDLNIASNYIHERLQEIGRTKIYYTLVQNAFADLKEKKSSTKIFYYNSSVNNIFFNSIEVLNISTYNSLKEQFVEEMEAIEDIVIAIRVIFIILFLIFSLIKIVREVLMAIRRIKSITSLKDMLFNKTEVKVEEEKETLELLNNEKDNISKFSEKNGGELLEEESEENSLSEKEEEENRFIYGNILQSEKEKNKMREKWSKNHFYENNFMDEGNKLIIQYTYNKLKIIFENMDFFQNEKFAEKLVFLKRRYKLNEQYEDKDDCELSSDIYQAISKISMINMDDIFYNVYYNQSYALNQSFKMFKSILDNSINKQSIILKNNKYINFGRILKFIYYIKKEKIQKMIEIIYKHDLKYKSKNEENINFDFNNIDNIDNNIDNNDMNNIDNNIENDFNILKKEQSQNKGNNIFFNFKSNIFPE